MQNWEKEINKIQYLKSFDIEKSFNSELITEDEFNSFMEKGGYIVVDENAIEKSTKDTSKLIKKEVWVNRGGKSFRQTVWVSPDDNKEVETPIGGELSPTVKGLEIERYSDKSILIKGDTYANIDLMRQIKSETGFGTWSSKAKGWIFGLTQLDKVLGLIWSDVKDKDQDKAQAIQNQKNSSLSEGDEINVLGEKGKVEEIVSDSQGIKYNVTLPDGTKLEGVDEKVMEVAPEKDDKKIATIINNAQPENRAKTEKQLFGIKPIENIHTYSLEDYMKLHGLSEEDIQRAINRIKPKEKKEGEKKRTTSGGGGTKSGKGQTESLTKNQLIGKLIIAHYQAVQKAIESGEEVPESALAYYPELAEKYSKQRQAMSEETKRKISEALKKNKPEEVVPERIKKEEEETEKKGVAIPDKKDYKPKDGESFSFLFADKANFSFKPYSNTVKTKDYTDIPALDVTIMKPKDVLSKERPYFIPQIDENKFKKNSYTLSAVKIGEDKYLVALNGYMSTVNYRNSFNENGNFSIMSLDLLTATQTYYQTKAKEEYKQSLVDEMMKRRERYSDSLQKNQGMSKEDADKKAAEYYDKPKGSRLSILPETKMTYDQMYMIEGYFNTEEKILSRQDVWEKYNSFKKESKQKFLDLELQREHDESAFTKGRETSYGDSGTKDVLFNDFGVKVKRQNGDEIKESEINQIKNALEVTSKLFGSGVKMNKEFGLKISHSGDVKMHASKATGIFFPFYNAIGVSNEYGGDMFNFVFGHEYAHFMDYWVGKNTGNHYASDKQGSTANRIASTFRSNMNKAQSSDYQNRTCECFARSLEMYTAIETKGENAIVWGRDRYFDAENYVSKDVYELQLKPLIKQFLEENKDILKSTLFDFFA